MLFRMMDPESRVCISCTNPGARVVQDGDEDVEHDEEHEEHVRHEENEREGRIHLSEICRGESLGSRRNISAGYLGEISAITCFISS